MSKIEHDLPDGTTAWIESIAGGEIIELYRHIARREAWVVDVKRTDGSVLEGFLRLQREHENVDPLRLERETRTTQALAAHGIPVATVHGWNPELRATLFARDPGRSDIDELDDARQQRAVMEDFMRVIARMHLLDLDELGLDDVMPYIPQTPRECALAEVDLIAKQWEKFLRGCSDPLMHFGLDWLERFAPEEVARTSLVQGDTGPVNFMFQGDRVSSLIDFETVHYGDPMEDLGNIALREFWNPSGGLKGLFELYSEESGISYDRFRAQYYAVHQNVRGMIPIHYVCVNAHPRESLAWYLCYRYAGDRSTCEMLAMAMGVEIERPEMPEDEGEEDVLARGAVYAQEHDVEPNVVEPFAASRAQDVKTLVRCMERRRRYGDVLARAELDDLGALLGKRPNDLETGQRELTRAIRQHRFDDDVVIQTLARKAYRDEWLYGPAVEKYPDRVWSDFD